MVNQATGRNRISFGVGFKPSGSEPMADKSCMTGDCHLPICGGCALQARGIQLSEMAAAVTLSQQLRTESCVVFGTRTGGNKDSCWTQEMMALVGRESRPHMREFLKSQGFTITKISGS